MTRPAPALAGIRVVDLTTVIFGPSATQVLADYGADVIKVEAPGGDSTRQTGPTAETGMASLFLGSNRNKRSVVLDLKQAEAREALDALIATADIFIHNVRPQKLAGLGLDPDKVRARHPRLIYVGLHGFGEDGPYGGLPAYDDIIQSLSGAADLGRRQTGVPRYMPTIVADKVAGQMAAHAALAALFQRERTGLGQFIEVPMFEAMVQFLMIEHLNARQILSPGDDGPRELEAMGYARTLAEWRKPYATRDGFVCLMPYNDRDWRAFFAAVGRDDLSNDARFANIADRTRNIAELYRLLETIVAQESTEHWLALGARLSIACAAINNLGDLETDPHLAAVGMFGVLPASVDWSMRYVRSPIRMTGSSVDPHLPPRLGQHTRDVLTAIGLEAHLVELLAADAELS